MPRTLILEPTRELAAQVQEAFETLGKLHNLSVALLIGGVAFEPQALKIDRGADVVIATPGRLLDHFERGRLLLTGIEMLVIDEADRMLDMGFIPDIERICKLLPFTRQTLFFSATMPGEIGKLAAELLRDPHKVSVAPSGTAVEKVDQSMIFVEAARKRALLAEMFADSKMSRAIVFTRTKRGADRVAKYLEAAGVNAAAIHGDKTQGQRERALAAFKAGQARALVATDIAARGIDVDGVTHVVNYELPQVAEAYVHRIGRTARAGAGGTAISLCADDERNLLRDIQRLTRQTIPTFDRRNCRELGAVAAMDARMAPEPHRTERAAQTRRDPGKPKGQPHRNRRGGRPSNAQAPKGRYGGPRPAQAAAPAEKRWTPLGPG